jgi:hypothetical protein
MSTLSQRELIKMNKPAHNSIPESGFGNCRWCGAENTRLQYLMCPDCFKLSNKVPSKAMVLLNKPEIKQKLGEKGATLTTFTPELRKFITGEDANFPPEKKETPHWILMQQVAQKNVEQKDIQFYIKEMVKNAGYPLPPTDEELFRIIGLECMLRFIIRTLVQRGELKIGIDLDEDEFIDDLQDKCMDATVLKQEEEGWKPKEALSQTMPGNDDKKGMNVRDIIMKKYGR